MAFTMQALSSKTAFAGKTVEVRSAPVVLGKTVRAPVAVRAQQQDAVSVSRMRRKDL